MRPGSFRNLRSFLDELMKRGELAVIEAPVSPELEIAEIHRRVIAAGGPALLFLKPGTSSFPVVTNLFGTPERASLAFGTRPEKTIEEIAAVLAEGPVLSRLWGLRSLARILPGRGTKRVRRAPVLKNSCSPRLDQLPALKCWPEDGGSFLTLPLVLTRDPLGGPENLGMYRMQVFDRNTTGMHWQIGKGGGFHYHVAEQRGEALPVSVFLGGPPVLTLAAVAPLPENVPEILLAALMAGRRIPFCRGADGTDLIAEAEFAFTGRVQPGKRHPEGPFGDHYGYYSLRHPFPVFDVERMYFRPGAIYPATVVGKPRQEDFFLGDHLQELLAPLFPLVMPGVRHLWSYGETGYHSLAGAIVRERYPREAMMTAFRILGEGQLSLTKFLMLSDQPVDLRDFPAFLSHILERVAPETDLYIFSDLSMDTLDYTGPEINRGSKGVLLGMGDARRKLGMDVPFSSHPGGVIDARIYCPGCLVVEAEPFSTDAGLPARLAKNSDLADWPLVVIVDDLAKTVGSDSAFLWTVFTRFEPAADLLTGRRRGGDDIRRAFPFIIDARMKTSYPAELFCDEATAELVSRRWKEYFPGNTVQMGDSDRGNLDS